VERGLAAAGVGGQGPGLGDPQQPLADCWQLGWPAAVQAGSPGEMAAPFLVVRQIPSVGPRSCAHCSPAGTGIACSRLSGGVRAGV